jgi:hypothetical protein
MRLIEALGMLIVVRDHLAVVLDPKRLRRPTLGHESIAKQRARDLASAVEAGTRLDAKGGAVRAGATSELGNRPRRVRRGVGSRNGLEESERAPQ